MPDLLFDIGWKSVLLAGAVLLACVALRDRAAGERVLLLRLGIGALLALPLLALAGPSLELAVLPAEEVVAAAPMAVEAVSDMAPMPASDGIDPFVILYCLGAGLILLRLGFGLFTLARWTRGARLATDPRWTHALARARGRTARAVRLLVSPKVDAPMSWGVAPAWILIGPGTEQRGDQAEAVVAHEMAHVRRFDWPMLMLAQLATALLWFNPLVWLLGRTLAAQIELAADEEALAQVARVDYAQTLLCVGAGHAHHSACGMTYARSSLGQRIRGVLEGGPKRPVSRLLAGTMLVAAIGFAGPLGALRLVPAEAQAAPEPMAEQGLLPVIVPQAEAGEAPQTVETPQRQQAQPQPRKRKKANAPVSAPAPMAPAKVAMPPQPSAPSGPWGLMPPRGKHAPQALAERKPWSGMPPEVRAKIEAAAKHAAPPKPPVPPAARAEASSMREAAQGMRTKAQAMEKIAADPNTPASVRTAHARAAGALHREAQQLEKNAKRMLEPR